MPLFTNRDGERTLLDQYNIGEYGIRQGTPVHVDGQKGARPLDLADGETVDGIALRKEQHPMKRGVLTDYVLERDGDSRQLVKFENVSNRSRSEKTGIYDPELMAPIMRVTSGDRIHLRSISEDCDSYNGGGPPSFSTNDPVSLVEDDETIEGVRVAPTDQVDGRCNSVEIGFVGKFNMHKTSADGFSTLVPIVVDK